MSARSFGKQTFSPKIQALVASLPWLEGKYSLEQRTQKGKSEPKLKRGQVSAHFNQPCQKGNRPLEFSVTLFNKSLFCLSYFELDSVPCNQDLKYTSPTLSRDQRGALKDSQLLESLEFGPRLKATVSKFAQKYPSPVIFYQNSSFGVGERHPQMIHVRINEIFEHLLNHHM